jgi:hypothetical protein
VYTLHWNTDTNENIFVKKKKFVCLCIKDFVMQDICGFFLCHSLTAATTSYQSRMHILCVFWRWDKTMFELNFEFQTFLYVIFACNEEKENWKNSQLKYSFLFLKWRKLWF